MHDAFDKPRNDRTPVTYVDRILNSVASSLVELGCFKDEDEFVAQMLTPLGTAFHELNAGGKSLESLSTRLSARNLAYDGPNADDYRTWGLRSCWSCLQALFAYRNGAVTGAWTYVVDARAGADALLGQRLNKHAAGDARRSAAVGAAVARYATDPKQLAKEKAFKLWMDWQTGHTTHESGAAFCRYVIEKLPALSSTRSVAKWCNKDFPKKRGSMRA